MTGISRRRLLQRAGGASLAAAAAGDPLRAWAWAPGVRFTHGVASGDPLADRVLLWTRAVGAGGRPAEVRWEVATDARFRRVVRRGRALADPRRDWTVKVDATGLAPGRRYFFRFRAGRRSSPVGRTRTAPAGSPEAVRLAVLTCGDLTRGLFNAYARVAERDDIDAVVHLGDYIYEGGAQDGLRPHDPPRECRTLTDYRRRYASYREDAALAALHRRHPVIWVWDDHETCNGTWRDGAAPKNHDPAEDGPFTARKAAALQAALEWMPIRSPDPRRPERIYRRFAFGDLVDLTMLDTRRIGRDRQGAGNVSGEFFTQTGAFADPGRQLLGTEQEAWLLAGLRRSRAAWRLLGNQVVMAHLKVVGAPDATGASVYANPDQWDGYAPARSRLFDALAGVEDVVVLTGDVHASLAFEVARDPNDPRSYDPVTGAGALAVEFVVPSVSSAGDPGTPTDPEAVVERLVVEGGDALRGPNPHLKYVEAKRNGYAIVDARSDRLVAEYWLVPSVERATTEQELARRFTVRRGAAHIVDHAAPPAAPAVPPTPTIPGLLPR